MTDKNNQQVTLTKFNDFPSSRPNTPLLNIINSPLDLKKLSENELRQLANELRAYILYSVSLSGGHLGANLGVIELTVALHYTFNSPHDKIIWDVGHQAYAHKVLTGRRDMLASIRQKDGLTAFPERQESIHDCFGVGHSSTSISAGLGMSLAIRYLTNLSKPSPYKKTKNREKVICVIGDSAMSAGMAFEAMNDAVQNNAELLVILNDNDMSISCATGGLSQHLQTLRKNGLETSTKKPNQIDNLFTAIGFNYIGILDGHNLSELTKTLTKVKETKGSVLLHVSTVKGKGFIPAEDDPVGYHAVSKISKNHTLNSKTDKEQHLTEAHLSYSQVFGYFLCDMAKVDNRIMAITPAMTSGSGMSTFALHYPEQFFDVAIAEQHAVTLAAGMATQALKPIVAIYSTFLQRGYDQLIHDVALQNLDVTFAIDRAGLVGADGATHAGVFDYAFLRCIPNIIIACPANENDCYQLLHSCYHYQGTSAIRYPRGKGLGIDINRNIGTSINVNVNVNVNVENSTKYTIGKAKIAATYSGSDLDNNTLSDKDSSNQISSLTNLKNTEIHLAVLAFGTVLQQAKQASTRLSKQQGIKITIINMCWVKPLDTCLIKQLLNDGITHLATVEEHVVMAGAGSAVNEYLVTQDYQPKITNIGIKDEFVAHASHEQQLKLCGLNIDGIYASLCQLIRR